LRIETGWVGILDDLSDPSVAITTEVGGADYQHGIAEGRGDCYRVGLKQFFHVPDDASG
jgi:hypothetical protein